MDRVQWGGRSRQSDKLTKKTARTPENAAQRVDVFNFTIHDVQLPGTYSGTDEGGRVHICPCILWARCAAREPWEVISLADSTAQRVLAMYGVQDGIVLVAGDGCESAKGAEEDIWEKVDGGLTVSLTVAAAHVPRS